MPFAGVGNVKNMKYLPMEHVKFVVNGNLYNLYNLENGSTWGIKPVTSPNDKGGSTIVAWEFLITAIHIENNYKNKAQMIRDFNTNKVTDIDLILKALPGTGNGAYMWITVDTLPVVCDYDVKFSIEDSGPRPRMIVKIEGIWSTDVFESIENIEYIFSQLSGFE